MASLFFIFFALSAALACEFQLPTQLVVFNSDLLNEKIFETKNCSESVKNDMTNFLKGFDGRVASFQIQELMASKGHHQLSITPQSILVQQFATIAREQLMLPQGIHMKHAQLQNQNNYLILNPGDQIEVSCNSCLYGTRQPLNLNIKSFDGMNSSHIVTADFVKMVKALKTISPVSAFSHVDTVQIQEVYTESIPHTDFIINRENLKFFKTNKPLKAGDLLRISDLTAINLVRAGLKTEVIIENKMIRIKTQGISRQNGSIGEFVEVFQPQKNKKYQGKVIDNNKILVEL